MESTSKREARKRIERHIAPAALPSFYTNFVNVTLSIWDVKLTLGMLQEASDKELVVRDVAEILMSPQHAKALLLLLESRIKIYEENWGPLPDVSKTITTSD